MFKRKTIGVLLILASAFSHIRYSDGLWYFGVGQIIISLVLVIIGLLFLLGSLGEKEEIIVETPETEDGKKKE